MIQKIKQMMLGFSAAALMGCTTTPTTHEQKSEPLMSSLTPNQRNNVLQGRNWVPRQYDWKNAGDKGKQHVIFQRQGDSVLYAFTDASYQTLQGTVQSIACAEADALARVHATANSKYNITFSTASKQSPLPRPLNALLERQLTADVRSLCAYKID